MDESKINQLALDVYAICRYEPQTIRGASMYFKRTFQKACTANIHAHLIATITKAVNAEDL